MRTVGFFLAILLLFHPAAEALDMSVGQEVANFQATALDGKKISLRGQHGKVVVIVYWEEGHDRSLPALKDISEAVGLLKNNAATVIAVVPASADRGKIKNILRENNLKFPVVLDVDRKIYSQYEIRVYPTTMIVDRDGKLAYVISSHPSNFKKLLTGHLRNALGELDNAGLEEAISTERVADDHAASEMNRLYNLALKFSKSDMMELAIGNAVKAVEAQPEAVKALVLLGFLQLKNDDADSALAVFEETLKIEPDSRDGMTGLGSVMVEKGEVDRAVEILNRALVANPYPQWTYYQLGRAYELKGEKDKSIEMYKKAMEKFINEQVLPVNLSNCD